MADTTSRGPEKRAHILCVTRAVWVVVFISLYPGTASGGTNPDTKLPLDSDLNKIEAALLKKYPNLKFDNTRMPIGDVVASPSQPEQFNIDIVRIRRDYYPMIPEIGDNIIDFVNQLLNQPPGQGEINTGDDETEEEEA